MATRVRFSSIFALHCSPFSHRLPLDSVMLVISELLPKVQRLQAAGHKPNPTSVIMDLLRSVTLTHVLPPAPPLAPRRFIVSLPQ